MTVKVYSDVDLQSLTPILREYAEAINTGGGGGGAATYEEVISGADPVVIDPDVAVTSWRTGGTKSIEIASLGPPSDLDVPFIKTIVVSYQGSDDIAELTVDNPIGFSVPLTLIKNQIGTPTATLQFVWNPRVSGWQALVGAEVCTNGQPINAGSGTISADEGVVQADTVTALTAFRHGADFGADGTFLGQGGETVTVQGGIITGIVGP